MEKEILKEKKRKEPFESDLKITEEEEEEEPQNFIEQEKYNPKLVCPVPFFHTNGVVTLDKSNENVFVCRPLDGIKSIDTSYHVKTYDVPIEITENGKVINKGNYPRFSDLEVEANKDFENKFNSSKEVYCIRGNFIYSLDGPYIRRQKLDQTKDLDIISSIKFNYVEEVLKNPNLIFNLRTINNNNNNNNNNNYSTGSDEDNEQKLQILTNTFREITTPLNVTDDVIFNSSPALIDINDEEVLVVADKAGVILMMELDTKDQTKFVKSGFCFVLCDLAQLVIEEIDQGNMKVFGHYKRTDLPKDYSYLHQLCFTSDSLYINYRNNSSVPDFSIEMGFTPENVEDGIIVNRGHIEFQRKKVGGYNYLKLKRAIPKTESEHILKFIPNKKSQLKNEYSPVQYGYISVIRTKTFKSWVEFFLLFNSKITVDNKGYVEYPYFANVLITDLLHVEYPHVSPNYTDVSDLKGTFVRINYEDFVNSDILYRKKPGSTFDEIQWRFKPVKALGITVKRQLQFSNNYSGIIDGRTVKGDCICFFTRSCTKIACGQSIPVAILNNNSNGSSKGFELFAQEQQFDIFADERIYTDIPLMNNTTFLHFFEVKNEEQLRMVKNRYKLVDDISIVNDPFLFKQNPQTLGPWNLSQFIQPVNSRKFDIWLFASGSNRRNQRFDQKKQGLGKLIFVIGYNEEYSFFARSGNPYNQMYKGGTSIEYNKGSCTVTEMVVLPTKDAITKEKYFLKYLNPGERYFKTRKTSEKNMIKGELNIHQLLWKDLFRLSTDGYAPIRSLINEIFDNSIIDRDPFTKGNTYFVMHDNNKMIGYVEVYPHISSRGVKPQSVFDSINRTYPQYARLTNYDNQEIYFCPYALIGEYESEEINNKYTTALKTEDVLQEYVKRGYLDDTYKEDHIFLSEKEAIIHLKHCPELKNKKIYEKMRIPYPVKFTDIAAGLIKEGNIIKYTEEQIDKYRRGILDRITLEYPTLEFPLDGAEIEGIVIDKQFQGGGRGKSFIKYIYCYLYRLGFHKLNVIVMDVEKNVEWYIGLGLRMLESDNKDGLSISSLIINKNKEIINSLNKDNEQTKFIIPSTSVPLYLTNKNVFYYATPALLPNKNSGTTFVPMSMLITKQRYEKYFIELAPTLSMTIPKTLLLQAKIELQQNLVIENEIINETELCCLCSKEANIVCYHKCNKKHEYFCSEECSNIYCYYFNN